MDSELITLPSSRQRLVGVFGAETGPFWCLSSWTYSGMKLSGRRIPTCEMKRTSVLDASQYRAPGMMSTVQIPKRTVWEFQRKCLQEFSRYKYRPWVDLTEDSGKHGRTAYDHRSKAGSGCNMLSIRLWEVCSSYHTKTCKSPSRAVQWDMWDYAPLLPMVVAGEAVWT